MALKMTKKMITCSFCSRPASKKKLYKCVEEDCAHNGEPYCRRCGVIAHESIDDHKFDVTADNVQEVSFEDESKDIQKGLNKVGSALTTYEEQQYGAVRQTYFGGVAGLLTQINTVNSVQKAVTNMKGAYNVIKNVKISTGMGSVADLATDGTKMMTASQTMLKTGSSVLGPAAIGAGIGAVVMAGYEVTLHSYRYWIGEIETEEEYHYNLKRGLSASAGMGLGNWGGTVLGASIGSLGGPIGALIGGIIGGLIGGAWGAKKGRNVFEKYSSDDFIYNEQKKREEFIRDALLWFGWRDIKVIEDKEKFNESEIRKRYRRLAKQYHPDKNNNSPESHVNFHALNTSLGCLLALLNKKDKRKVIKRVQQIKAISLVKNIEIAERKLRQKRLFYILGITIQYDDELTLDALCQYRKNDILELIDEINNGGARSISVVKKNKFAKIVAKDSF